MVTMSYESRYMLLKYLLTLLYSFLVLPVPLSCSPVVQRRQNGKCISDDCMTDYYGRSGLRHDAPTVEEKQIGHICIRTDQSAASQ